MYKVTSSEERNEKATEFETKSLLYLINYYENSNEVHWLIIDFFNDVTGVNRLQDSCYDIQSKGVKNIAPTQLGRFLVTLFKNYISEFNFVDYILFVESLSTTLIKELGDKKVFKINDLSQDSCNAIKDGLKSEASKKIYIEDKTCITDENINKFVENVTFVIDSHTKEEYIKDAVELSSSVIVDDAYLRKIFKEIRDKQSSKKNNNAEGKLLSSIGCFYNFDKHIRKEEIEDLIINRICFNSALSDLKSVPISFSKIIRDVDETIYEENIEKNQDDIFRLLNDKNNKKAFWDLFSEIVLAIKNNPKLDLENLYNLVDKNKVLAVHHLDAMSCKYFIALIKERIK